MSSKGDDDAAGRVRSRELSDSGDHTPVAEVEPVVGADRDHGTFSGPDRIREIADDVHAANLPVAGGEDDGWFDTPIAEHLVHGEKLPCLVEDGPRTIAVKPLEYLS